MRAIEPARPRIFQLPSAARAGLRSSRRSPLRAPTRGEDSILGRCTASHCSPRSCSHAARPHRPRVHARRAATARPDRCASRAAASRGPMRPHRSMRSCPSMRPACAIPVSRARADRARPTAEIRARCRALRATSATSRPVRASRRALRCSRAKVSGAALRARTVCPAPSARSPACASPRPRARRCAAWTAAARAGARRARRSVQWPTVRPRRSIGSRWRTSCSATTTA